MKNKKPTIGIYINSSGRASSVKIIKQIPKKWRAICHIVVPSSQAEEYRSANPDWSVVSVDTFIPEYLSSQRQWVMDTTPYDYVWFMDDDLTFLTRHSGVKLRTSTPKDMEALLKLVCLTQRDEGIPLVGISTRLGNNRVTEDHADITRVTQSYVVNKKVFEEVGATFAPFEPFLMQDFHINLSFLKAGKKNRVIYKYAMGGASSNAKGGCSTYRTPELMAKVANFLAEEHKGFVTVKIKKTKGGWGGFPVDEEGNVVRTDVIVHWKKAFQQSKRLRSGISSFIRKKK